MVKAHTRSNKANFNLYKALTFVRNGTKKIIIIGLLFTSLKLPVMGQNENDKKKSELYTSVILETESAYIFKKENIQKSEFQIFTELKLKFNDHVKLTTKGRIYAELTDHLEPGIPEQNATSDLSKKVFVGDYLDFELREIYLDLKLGKTYWRIGKQQIVWGEADGLKVLDIVNPMNFREFLMDDFEDSRVSLWSIKGSFSLKPINLELIWIPDLSYNIFPLAPSSTFIPFQPDIDPPSGVELKINNTDKPDNIIADSDIGMKVSSFWKGWDLSVSYLYHYDDFPILLRSFGFENGIPALFVTPTYKRNNLIGGTFSNAFGNFSFRGEIGFFSDRYFSTTDPNDVDGIYQSDQMKGSLGFDFYGLSQSLISVQFIGDWTEEDNKDLLAGREQFEAYLTALFQTSQANEKIKIRIFVANGLRRSEGLVSSKISYTLYSNLDIWAGLDLFYGNEKGLIGQFNDADRVLLGLAFGLGK